MHIFQSFSELSELLSEVRSEGKSIGFVPTMGALHSGHLSLVQTSSETAEFTLVSIFVNPTQFNDSGDLDKYPRDIESDLKILSSTRCDAVFSPSVSEVYPDASPAPNIDYGLITSSFEASERPGHFNGVVQVLNRFFSEIKPDFAFFGEKDFQQLAVVRRMVLKSYPNLKIVPCPTLREPSGLAMSSRNELLNPQERRLASVISETLSKGSELRLTHSSAEAKAVMQRDLSKKDGIDLEYLDIVDPYTFEPISDWTGGKECRILVAARIGSVRLIDNMAV